MSPRVLFFALLCAGAARAQDRTAAQILDDHAAAVGDVRTVRFLAATCEAGDGRHARPGTRTQWVLESGHCVREIPTPKGDYPWREYFAPGRAFVSYGAFERYRPNQLSTRGGYYFMKALAEPFPLRAYILDAALGRTLKAGVAEAGRRRFNVLYTPFDDRGVRAVFLLDERTHLLENVRYEAKENEPFVNLTYSGWKKVGGVMLPGSIYARFRVFREDLATHNLEPLDIVREERSIEWVRDPHLRIEPFVVPGLAGGSEEGGCFERRVYETGPDPHEVAVGDLDGDGKADIAVACEGGVWVHFGGAEDRPVAVQLGVGHYRGMAIDDLDCDGRLEIVTTSNVRPARTFHVVSFDAARSPKVRTIGGAPAFTADLITPDLDRDGIPDLVAVGFASRDLQIRFGNGSGGIRPVGSPWPLDPKGTGQRRGFAVAAGNLDGDSMTDFAVADGTRVVVFRGQPNLSFQPRLSVPPDDTWEWRVVAVAWADLDGDGYDDLLVAREHPTEDLRDDLRIVRNVAAEEGGRKLEAGEPMDVGARVQAVAAGSFDADPAPDIVATSFLTGELTLLRNDGKGGFDAKKAERYASGRGTCRLAVADVDGDGRDDVVAVNRLDDTLAVFLGRKAPPVRRGREARAEPCRGPTEREFRLQGLSDPYDFAGEFRLPASIADPSGIAWMGGVVNSQFLIVSDKANALFRGTLDRATKRFLVGPPVPLRGLAPGGLDLEDAAFDRWTGTVFLAAEADSSILRCTIFGDVLGRVPTGIAAPGNDGVEAIALRRKLDGTPLLYVFRERMGITGIQPPVLAFELDEGEDGFVLRPRGGERKLPLYLPDQTAAVVADERLYVVSRLARGICETGFDEDGFARDGVRMANFKRLVDDLGLGEGELAKYGNVEGMAIDAHGDLFLLVDNNGEVLGREENRGREGRLLWFLNRGAREERSAPVRVLVKHIHIPFKGAEGADESVTLTREDAAKLADEVARRAREGEDFESLAASPAHGHYVHSPWKREMQIVRDGTWPGPQVRADDLPTALARLAFNLDVGEVGLCGYHPEESPRGYHVLLRIE